MQRASLVHRQLELVLKYQAPLISLTSAALISARLAVDIECREHKVTANIATYTGCPCYPAPPKAARNGVQTNTLCHEKGVYLTQSLSFPGRFLRWETKLYINRIPSSGYAFLYSSQKPLHPAIPGHIRFTGSAGSIS